MGQHNSPSNDNLEQLAAATNEVEEFVYSKGIKVGEEKISAAIIYKEYKKWRRGRETPRKAKSHFFMLFGKLFQSCRTNYERFYYLDPSSFDLSEKNYWRVRREIRNEKKKTNKKA